MFIKVTALGTQTNIATVYFDEPKVILVNVLKIWSAIPGKKGTELRDESGKNIITVLETPEEINELLK